MSAEAWLVDSHCHLNFPELASRLPEVFARMRENRVAHALCVGVNLKDLPAILALADAQPFISASVGVHPDYEDAPSPDEAALARWASHPKVVAIGETGLDYYRLKEGPEWQRERFRVHIRAARACGKPLIVHTREAASDTLAILAEEGADAVGGVMHCFTESWEVAQRAMDLNFLISFSGIVTFKSAAAVREVVKKVPLGRMLVETDSPSLAPVPFRGKVNEPGFVRHVAEEIARIKEVPFEQVARATTDNFRRLFGGA